MNHSEVIQYTSSFDVRKGRYERLLPIGAMIIDAYANANLGVTVNFMASRRRDVERIPLPSAEECATGNRPTGFFRYIFRIAAIGTELPPNISWCTPIKIEDSRRFGDKALYLFYAVEP